MTSSMPSSRGDPLRGGAAVAGEHDRPDAQFVAARRPLAAAVSRGASAMAMTAGGLAVDRDLDARAALAGELVRRARPARRGRCPRGRAGARCRQRGDGRRRWRAAPWPGTASNASARRRLEPRCVGAALTIASASGCSLSPSAAATRRSTSSSPNAVGGHDCDDLGLAARQRAGLVEHDGVERGGLLERHRVLEQDAALGAQPGADHDRRRGRQPERVRAGDDDDGDREQQRVLDVAADERSTRRRRSARRRAARRARARRRPGRPGAGRAPWSSAPPGRA